MSATALIALHYQNDVLHPDGRIRVGLGEGDAQRPALIAAARRLLDGARERGWVIAHVRVAFRPDGADIALNMPIMRAVLENGAVREGAWGAEFLAELAPRDTPREFVMKHARVSGFYGTPLDQILQLARARRVVIAGVATHSVVESTVRDAADRGLEVWVPADACAAADPAAHAASLASMSLIARISDVAGVLNAGASP